jgi:hypothetical protein
MKKGLIFLVLMAVFQLLTDEGLCQPLKSLWALNGFGSLANYQGVYFDGPFASIAISQNKKYLLSFVTPVNDATEERHELRLFILNDGNYLGTPFTSYVGQWEGTRITQPVPSADHSKLYFLTYSHYYHSLPRQGYWSFDSAYVTVLDFRDTLHKLFQTQNFYTNARYEFARDSKHFIIYDKDTAKFLNAETGALDYEMPFQTNEYIDTRDTVYSSDSIIKAQYLDVWNGGGRLVISRKKGNSYDTIFTKDSLGASEPILFSPNSKFIIYRYGESYNVNRIDSTDIKLLFSLSKNVDRAVLEFSPDSKYLLCNFYYPWYPIEDFEDTVTVWDLQTGKLKTSLFAEAGQKPDFFFFLDSELFTGSQKLYKWHYPSFEYAGIVVDDGYTFCDISSLMTQVLTSSADNFKILDLFSGKKILQFNNQMSQGVKEAHFTQTGDTIVSINSDWSINLFSTLTGERIKYFPPIGRIGKISADSRLIFYIVGGGYPNTMRLHSINLNGDVILDKLVPYSIFDNIGISPDHQILAAARGINTPDSKKLLVTSYGNSTLWDVSDRTRTYEIGNSVTGIFSPDGKYLATNVGTTNFVSIDSPQTPLSFFINDGLSGNQGFSEDGKYFGKGSGAMAIYALPPFPNSSVKYFPSTNNSDISLFPNPSTGLLYVKLGANIVGATELRIYDLLGRKVKSQKLAIGENTIDLDVSNLPSGGYIIAVASAGGAEAQKFSLVRN